jgi:hypothetical protein
MTERLSGPKCNLPYAELANLGEHFAEIAPVIGKTAAFGAVCAQIA